MDTDLCCDVVCLFFAGSLDSLYVIKFQISVYYFRWIYLYEIPFSSILLELLFHIITILFLVEYIENYALVVTLGHTYSL